MTRLVSPGEYYESGRTAWMSLPQMEPTNSADWLPSRTSDMVICDHAFGLPLNYDKTAKRVRQQYDNNTTPRIRGLRHIWTTFEAQDFQGLPDLEWGGLENHPLGCQGLPAYSSPYHHHPCDSRAEWAGDSPLIFFGHGLPLFAIIWTPNSAFDSRSQSGVAWRPTLSDVAVYCMVLDAMQPP